MKNIAGYMATLLVVFMILGIISSPFSDGGRVAERLLFGFIPFLRENVAAISWNARTWGPGLAAFVIALLVVHAWLARWAARTGRRWSFLTSFCLLMLVPTLFVISFIVPGVLLQWEALREVVWINVR